MSERLVDILIRIISEELNKTNGLPDTVKSQITAELLQDLYKLSKSHDLSHIVADTLEKSGLLDSAEISQKFEKQKALSVFRYMQMDYDLNVLYDVFESNKIPYMPLKGSVIREYYPQPEMRTSCDIDILVAKSDIERAIDALVSGAEYKTLQKTMHDVSLYSPSNTHLELHHTLSETDEENDFLSDNVWKTAHIKSDTEYCYLMDNDMMLAYLTVHAAKHFESGGCGIRPFMDFHVLRKSIDFNFNNVKKILSVYGLETFFDKCMHLTDVWFGDKEHTELTRNMQDFILNAGVYGNAESRVAVKRKGEKSKAKYIFGRIFLPYSELCKQYKKLRKYPILYPYYTVARWFRMVFKGHKRVFSEIKNNTNVSEERAEFIKEMLDELNLTKEN